MEEMILKEENGQLLVGDDVGLLGARTFNETKPGNSGIVYCNYIPMTLSEEEWKKRERAFRANKTYAKVSRQHPNPYYRGKRGIIWETNFLNGNEQCLLEIETVNRVSEDGFSTLVGVVYPNGYNKIWFPKAILENFEKYDENGDLVK